MSRLSDKDVKRWTDRLAFSHRVWERQGCVASRVGVESSEGEDIWRFISGYRGQQWDGWWGGIPPSQLAVTTLFFAAYRTWASGLLTRNPRIQALPRMRPGSKRATDIMLDAISVESVLNYDWQKMKVFRQFNRCLQSAFFSPTGGFLQHGYTPSEEFYSEDERKRAGAYLAQKYGFAEPDRPWIRNVKPWDIRVDPRARTFEPDEDAEWVAFRQLRTMDQVKANPNLIVRDDLTPTISIEPQNASETFIVHRDPEREEYVESWVIYEKCERTWFELTPGSEKPIREREDWPLPWKDLPYDWLGMNEQLDSAFVVPYAQVIWPAIVERNKLRTLLQELCKRLRRLIILNPDAIRDGDVTKLTGGDIDLAEIILTKDGASANEGVLTQAQVGGLDPSLLAMDAQLLADVREALGQSQMDRASRINVESATEAAQVQQGSANAGAWNQLRLEDCLTSCARHYGIARQATTTEEELVPILGIEDTRVLMDGIGANWLNVTPEQMKGEYDFEIVSGSTLPRDRAKETAAAMLDLQVAANPAFAPLVNAQQLLMNLWLARGINPANVMQTTEQIMSHARMAEGTVPPEGGGAGAGADFSQAALAQIEAARRGGVQ